MISHVPSGGDNSHVRLGGERRPNGETVFVRGFFHGQAVVDHEWGDDARQSKGLLCACFNVLTRVSGVRALRVARAGVGVTHIFFLGIIFACGVHAVFTVGREGGGWGGHK